MFCCLDTCVNMRRIKPPPAPLQRRRPGVLLHIMTDHDPMFTQTNVLCWSGQTAHRSAAAAFPTLNKDRLFTKVLSECHDTSVAFDPSCSFPVKRRTSGKQKPRRRENWILIQSQRTKAKVSKNKSSTYGSSSKPKLFGKYRFSRWHSKWLRDESTAWNWCLIAVNGTMDGQVQGSKQAMVGRASNNLS